MMSNGSNSDTENTIKQSGSENILPGECQANTENVRNDPLLKLQHLKEGFDPNPNLHRDKGNPDWRAQLTTVQIREEGT